MNKTILLIALGATILTVGMFGSMATQDASATHGGGNPWSTLGEPCTTDDGDEGTLWYNAHRPGRTECRD